jgi:tetratricopeptide (TPR) repeat protein
MTGRASISVAVLAVACSGLLPHLGASGLFPRAAGRECALRGLTAATRGLALATALVGLLVTTCALGEEEPTAQGAPPPLVEQAVTRGSEHGPADAAAEADALSRKVEALHRSGRYAEAIVLAEKVVALREKALGPEHPDTALSLNNLAELYEATGAYAKAEPLYRRALAIREKTFGPEHPDTATSLNNLALLYGNYSPA